MSLTKETALKANGIEVMYDAFSDRYHIRRTKPAEHMQIILYKNEFEHHTVTEIYNMFDRHARYEDDFVHLGPTTKELRDPRIRNAWEELEIIRKLIGIQK